MAGRGRHQWREIERVHKAHPDWTAVEIASELGAGAAWVRATAKRRGWQLPIRSPDTVTLQVPRERLDRLCKQGERPVECLRRMVHKMLARENARAEQIS